MSVQGTIVKYLFGKRHYTAVSAEDNDEHEAGDDAGLDRGKIARKVLQCSILFFVYHYVVSLDIANVQSRYRDFRAKVFNPEGEFQESLWVTYKGRTELCQIAMWNRPFYYSVLFCWSLVMMIEIRKSEELIRHLMAVPICNEPREMLSQDEGDGEQYVVAFTRWTRFWIFIFVGVPKMGISVILLLLGCEWLSATIQFESLVMNTVAMEFIVQLDEILFEAVLPQTHREDVENIDFLLQRELINDLELTRRKTKSYRKSLGYLCGLLMFILLYAEYMQDVLPTDIRFINDKCQEVLVTQFQPLCSGWTWYLRGRPSAFECFPIPQSPAEFTVPT